MTASKFIGLTVIVPTHDPNSGRLKRTLDGLRRQSLPPSEWELLLVDNASKDPLAGRFDLSWHPRGRVVREERLGLTPARLRGFAGATGDALVMVDDDNVLAPDYLEKAQAIFRGSPRVGAFGGRNLPEFERPPDEWFRHVRGPLGLSDHGDIERVVSWRDTPRRARTYPECAPVGAGMCLRREVAEAWAVKVQGDEVRARLDRTGKSLASGGDNDIVLSALADGWDVAYYPCLTLTHLIDARRTTLEYHEQVIRASSRSWVTVLTVHGVCPWAPIHPWTAWPRKLKAALRFRPWVSPQSRLRWQGACGQFEGRVDAYRMQRSRS